MLHDDKNVQTNIAELCTKDCLKRLPFSISSAHEVFQRRMFKILNGIEAALCMMDDVLVLGKGSIDGWRWY